MPEYDPKKEAFRDWAGRIISPAREAEERRRGEFQYQLGRLGYPSGIPGAEPSPAGTAAAQLLHDYFAHTGVAPDYLAKASARDVATIRGKAVTGAAGIRGGAAKEIARIGAEGGGMLDQFPSLDMFDPSKGDYTDFSSVYTPPGVEDMPTARPGVAAIRPLMDKRRKRRTSSIYEGVW